MNVGQFDLTAASLPELKGLAHSIEQACDRLREDRRPLTAAALESFIEVIDSEVQRRLDGGPAFGVNLACAALRAVKRDDLECLGRAAARSAAGATRLQAHGAAAFWFEIAACAQRELWARSGPSIETRTVTERVFH